MRTNYINPFNTHGGRRPKRSTWGAALGVLVLLALIAAALWWRGSLATMLWQMLGPIASVRNSFDSTDVAGLRDELARARAAAADRNIVEAELAALRTTMARTPQEERRVLAAVLQRPPATPYDTLLLDVGASHGIVDGARVYAGGAVAVGTITEVHDTTARATLYSAAGREQQALVLHPSTGSGQMVSIPIILVGQGAGSFVGELPAGSPVTVGDSAVFVGLETVFPAVVRATTEREGESFMQVYFSLPINIFELRYVEVGL